MFLNKRK